MSHVHGSTTYQNSVEEAIYLYWGSEKSEVAIPPINDLSTTNDVYRYVACESVASASLTGKVQVTFTIADGYDELTEKTYSLEGLTVAIYRTSTLQNDSNRDLSGATLLYTLNYNEEHLTHTAEFDVEEGGGASYYCLKFKYNGDEPATGHEWGGTMTISQQYVND